MSKPDFLNSPMPQILARYPAVKDFLQTFSINFLTTARTFTEEVASFEESFWNVKNITSAELTELYIHFMDSVIHTTHLPEIKTIEVIAGIDKCGNNEHCNLQLVPGEITSIVGPTGSGKSRLLADIEWLADGDTPSRRKIKVNGSIPDDTFRQRFGGKIVAQITQNMNFVLDMNVADFLYLHAQSRFIADPQEKVSEVIVLANELCGEQFIPFTPITSLSGGQSRALMIADVMCIGNAPVILIDELENAGIDKKKALDLLASKDKIVLMATHDPFLILQAHRRVVIRNGGMINVIEVNESEKKIATRLQKVDVMMQKLREVFRTGGCL